MSSYRSENVEQEIAPRLISGIGRWELFPGMFIIGNVELDRYLRVPAESVEPIWCAVQYCDGNRRLSEVQDLVLGNGWKLNVAELYRKLVDAGLVMGSAYSSDLNRLSVTWCEARISSLFPVWRGWRALSHLLTVTAIFSFLVASVVWLFAPVKVAGIWTPTGLEIAVAMTTGVLISVFVHEAGHAVAACAEGLPPSRVRLLGYLGLIPYTMLSIPGLYTIRPAGRLRVWLAGPLASLGLASLSYLASSSENLPLALRVWLDRMSLANITMAVWNCCPLIPTDGYFIVSTLLKQANWRLRSWRELVRCVRHRRRPQMLLFLYALASTFALALVTFKSVRGILSATHFSWLGYALVLLLIFMFGFKRAALKRRNAAASMGGM